MEQVEIVDRHGRARPSRRGDHLADGERLRVPHAFTDARTRDALRAVAADSQPRGYRSGYQTLDATCERSLADEAARAYAAKCARLSRRDAAADDDAPVTHDAASARAIADRAYEDRKVWLSNAWRNK
jgi:hypothetical protein